MSTAEVAQAPVVRTFIEHVQAAFSGIWIESWEPDLLTTMLMQACKAEKWYFMSWNVAQGLRLGKGIRDIFTARNENIPLPADVLSLEQLTSPRGAVHYLPTLLEALTRPQPADAPEGSVWKQDSTLILFMQNLHMFLGADAPVLIQELINTLHAGSSQRLFVVNVSPCALTTMELERQFVTLRHELPRGPQFHAILANVVAEETIKDMDEEAIKHASSGLTTREAENAYALSVVRNRTVVPKDIWHSKYASIRKTGTLEPLVGDTTFADIGGLNGVKDFMVKSLQGSTAKVRPKGVLLVGVPGTGKSALAKALGNAAGRQTLALDIGGAKNKYVGESEKNIRRALEVVDVMEPAILFIDEIEKAFAGATASNDSGVSSGIFGTFLTWANDHTSDIYLVATANNVSMIPLEFMRAERFDGIFFLDLPTKEERALIWNIYLKAFELKKQPMPRDTDWTGAEIKTCCRLAALTKISLVEASEFVVPIAVKDREKVTALRTAADGRYISAGTGKVFHASQLAEIEETVKAKRGIHGHNN